MDADFEKHSTQVTITNLPDKCTAKALVHLLDTEAGYWILRLAIKEHTREAFRGQPPSRELVAFVDFASEDGAKEACGLSGEEALVLGGRTLQLRLGNTRRGGNVAGQKRPPLKLSRCSLHMGTLVTPQEMRVLWGASERGLDVEFDFARGLVRWYFQTSNTKLNSAPGGKGLIDVVLTSHMRDVRRVRELKNVLNGGRVSVPLLIQLWKPPRVSYRLPARETYEDPKLQSRFLW